MYHYFEAEDQNMYNTYYTFTGNTYRNRDELNRYGIGACWNPAEKRWELVGSLLERTLVNLRRMGVRIATSQCEPDGWVG